jgi:hypothetical protein
MGNATEMPWNGIHGRSSSAVTERRAAALDQHPVTIAGVEARSLGETRSMARASSLARPLLRKAAIAADMPVRLVMTHTGCSAK